MLFAVAGFLVASADKEFGLQIVVPMQALMFVGIAFFFYKLTALISLRYWIVGLALITAYFLSTGVYGSEAHVNALMLIGGVYYLAKAAMSDRVIHWIGAGFLLGLSILARLDNLFVVGALFLFAWWGCQPREGKRMIARVVAFSLPLAFLIIPYMASNQIFFGHLVPISGAIKSIFPVISINISNLGRFGQITALFALLSVIMGMGFVKQPVQMVVLRGLGVGVLLHALYVAAFTNHYTFWPWYYVAGVLNAGLVISAAFEWIAPKVGRFIGEKYVIRVSLMIAGLLFIGAITRGWLKAYGPVGIGSIQLPQINEYRWPNEVAIWLKNNLPADSAIFVYDYPGAIAYYSDLRILPMDGLVNDFDYNERLKESGIRGYLCANDVGYFLGPMSQSVAGYQEYKVLNPLYREPAGVLRLPDKDMIVEVKDIVEDPRSTPPLAVWALVSNCQSR
jgi:hypothetical protein